MLIYRLFLFIYRLAIGITALYNAKAKKWIAGRRDWRQELAHSLQPNEKRIWIHCSSLGEYEQGRPLIELLRQQYPGYKIVLTFFSPSGYEACSGYDGADYIFYLPMDGYAPARDFVAAIAPSLVVFVKYEFWHYYLHELRRRGIPLLLVSAAFRQGQAFFSWYGGFFRNMLGCFSHIHVQDDNSAALLKDIGIEGNVSVSGDTRYDRVTAIARRLRPIEEADHFRNDRKLIVAGSTWPADEALIKECLPHIPARWKLILAPHEIDAKHILHIQELFGDDMALYSALGTDVSLYRRRILVIDNIGMLSSLYAYGDIAWVGGGFAKSGIHNTLEPAIFGLPVLMGAEYRKFAEAVKLVELGAAFPVTNSSEAIDVLVKLADDDAGRQVIAARIKQFMNTQTGAADRIVAQVALAGWLST